MVRDDVLSAILDILQGHSTPLTLNHTYITLILNKPRPSTMADFWLIGLCNIIYKLVTKVISNRLKGMLPDIIFVSQSTFTSGRLVTDNIICAFEMFHAVMFHAVKCHMSASRTITTKLGMVKVYDRVEWPFLEGVMIRLGFRQSWVDLVIWCVKSTTFSFLVNGVPRGNLILSRGLHHRDPISPYLFLSVYEGLSNSLRRAAIVHAILC